MRKGLVVALVFAVCGLVGVSWDGGWEGRPAGNLLASDIDTFIQESKVEIRQHMEVEHNIGSVSASGDNGLHSLGSARAFMQNAAPTDINAAVATRAQYNAAASADGTTVLGDVEFGASGIDLGTGRLWVDEDGLNAAAAVTADDRMLNVWTDTVGFEEVRARDVLAAGVGGHNLVFNGSFEITDGTGLAASTTVPSGWGLVLTPTIGYVDPTLVSEGEGLMMTTTATVAPNEGVDQSFPNLKALRTYTYRARVNPTAPGSCELVADDGTTSATDTSLATGAFETLEVEHTTTGAPATVTLDLRSVGIGDVCAWDHVTVYENDRAVSQPGIVVMTDTDATGGGLVPDLIGMKAASPVGSVLTLTYTPPGPGYILRLDASISSGNTTTDIDSNMTCNLDNTGTDIASSFFASKIDSEAGAQIKSSTTHTWAYVINPVPGTPLTFTVECWEDGFDLTTGRTYNANAAVSTLSLMAMPTR